MISNKRWTELFSRDAAGKSYSVKPEGKRGGPKPWKPSWLKGGWAVCHPVYGIVVLSGEGTETRAHEVSAVLNRIYGFENSRETVDYLRAERKFYDTTR